MKTVSSLFLFLAVLIICHTEVQAGEPRLISTYGDWSAYYHMDGANKVCYMASKAKNPKTPKRGEAYAMITHRPADHVRNEFSYLAGYEYSPGSEASVEIDGQNFILFTKGDSAWTSDADTDTRLSKAIASGTSMIVRGKSAAGTQTVDTIGLRGSSEARKKIDQQCGN